MRIQRYCLRCRSKSEMKTSKRRRRMYSRIADPVVGALDELGEQRHVVDDLHGALEPGVLGGRGRRVLREGSRQALELGPELAERLVVGQHDEAHRYRRHARRPRELVRDQSTRRVLRGHLVAQQVLHERVVQLLGQDVRGVLLDAAEGVAPAVLADECQALGLLSAHAAHRREPAGFARHVEHLGLDRRRPQLAVRRSEHRLVEAAGAVLGASRDPLGARLLLRRGSGREREQQQARNGRRAGHASPPGTDARA